MRRLVSAGLGVVAGSFTLLGVWTAVVQPGRDGWLVFVAAGAGTTAAGLVGASVWTAVDLLARRS